MTQPKDYSAIGKARYFKQLALKSVAAIAVSYSVLGMLIDAVPFPGEGFIHSSEVKNENTDRYSPTGKNQFKKLDLSRNVNPVSDIETQQARELAGGDGKISAKERNAFCSQLVGRNDQLVAANVMIEDIRSGRIPGVKLGSSNMNGCDQPVNK